MQSEKVCVYDEVSGGQLKLVWGEGKAIVYTENTQESWEVTVGQ